MKFNCLWLLLPMLVACGGGQKEMAQPEAIDLGLSVKWASYNVGAASPEDFGNYYAWGYAETSSSNSSDSYKYARLASDGTPLLSKYCNDSAFGTDGFSDGKTTIEAADDAATANLGSKWRTPTLDEWKELADTANCAWEWTRVNGVSGCKVTSKKAGFTDNSIFIPAAGFRNRKSVEGDGGTGSYWTASLYEPFPSMAWNVRFTSDEPEIDSGDRYFGNAIRPVTAE
jgi:uncharacterized protein (TIGR02145 family)